MLFKHSKVKTPKDIAVILWQENKLGEQVQSRERTELQGMMNNRRIRSCSISKFSGRLQLPKLLLLGSYLCHLPH